MAGVSVQETEEEREGKGKKRAGDQADGGRVKKSTNLADAMISKYIRNASPEPV